MGIGMKTGSRNEIQTKRAAVIALIHGGLIYKTMQFYGWYHPLCPLELYCSFLSFLFFSAYSSTCYIEPVSGFRLLSFPDF